MAPGIRQSILSSAVFVAVLVALISVDERVHERFRDLVNGGNGVSPWGDRAGDLIGALGTALRTQSIENAPMLVFAAVGAVLVLFMVKT